MMAAYYLTSIVSENEKTLREIERIVDADADVPIEPTAPSRRAKTRSERRRRRCPARRREMPTLHVTSEMPTAQAMREEPITRSTSEEPEERSTGEKPEDRSMSEKPEDLSTGEKPEDLSTSEKPAERPIRETVIDPMTKLLMDRERLRDVVFRLLIDRRDGWKCLACGARCDLQVDHVKSRALYPALRWDPRNVWSTCARCHSMKSDGILKVERLPDGRLRITRPSIA